MRCPTLEKSGKNAPHCAPHWRIGSGSDGTEIGAGGVYERGGNWYFKQRVPRRFEALDQRRPGRIALKTDSEREAHAKAPIVAAELWAYWEALEAGNGADAKARHASAVKLAKARGFAYRPAGDLAAGDLAELVERLKSLVGPSGVVATGPEAKAVLGMITAPRWFPNCLPISSRSRPTGSRGRTRRRRNVGAASARRRSRT